MLIRNLRTGRRNFRAQSSFAVLINELWQNSYIVKSKVGSVAGDSYKCDFDVEMTLDISRMAYGNAPDTIIIISGDIDFIPEESVAEDFEQGSEFEGAEDVLEGENDNADNNS